MSNHDNRRRGEKKRTEHGSHYDMHSKGSVSRSPSKARASWKKVNKRAARRTGKPAAELTRTKSNGKPLPFPSPQELKRAADPEGAE